MLMASVILPGHAEVAAPPDGAGGTAPSGARLMNYQAATQLVGVGEDPGLSPRTPVWVVTVGTAQPVTQGTPQPFTVIVEPGTGAILNSCMGCGPPGRGAPSSTR